MNSGNKDKIETLSVPVSVRPSSFGGFHHEVASTNVQGKQVVISSGFGCGHTEVYIAVEGQRVLAADLRPMLEDLVRKALEIYRRSKL